MSLSALETYLSNNTSIAYDYYEYNLLNRLSLVENYDGTEVTSTVSYKYNPDGIRIEKNDNGTVISYLIDPYNHTDYAQVFVESDGTNTTSYVIGDDVLAQVTGDSQYDVEYLLYDGHGSTRQVLASDGSTVSESYSYDAYGVMLGGNPMSSSPAATNMLYAGEQWDNSAQMYYNRARYYDPLNGRFNSLDPYAGNMQDPQSLHKYLYVHNNPVNNIDPTGMFSLGEINLVQSIQAKLKEWWNSTPIRFMRRGLDPTRKKFNIYFCVEKGLPIHCYIYVEKTKSMSGFRYEVNPVGTNALRSLTRPGLSKWLKVVAGKLTIGVTTTAEVDVWSMYKIKIASFTNGQFGMWNVAVTLKAFDVGMEEKVLFNLGSFVPFLSVPGVFNCTKWASEAAISAIPIQVLPF
jgi:RHS repeat-associated protein